MPDQGMSWGDFQKEKLYKGGYKRLSSWKDDGNIEIWIHTASAFFKRLFIMIPYVAEKEDEKTGKSKRVINWFPYVSHEEIDDYINRKKNGAYYRCPLLRLIDWLADNGHIDDDETVFDVSIGDRKRDRICTKADFINDTDAGGDWQLSMKPAMQYVMAVIDNKKPSDGIVIAAEKFSLGEAIKRAVRQEIDRKGLELGDPNTNPYCFKWVFDSNARTPGDYYQAYPLERVELTDEIAELLNEPAQDVDSWVEPGDTDFLRKIFEAHVTVDDVPWDELFDNVYEERSTFGNQKEDTEDEPAEEKKPPKKRGGGHKRTRAAAKKEPEPEPEPEEENEDDNTVPCPSCRGKGKKRNKPCKVCDGTGRIEAPEDDETQEEEEETPPDPPPKKRQRRARKPAKKPEPEPEEEMDECGGCNKPIPFDADSCPHCGVTFE